MSKTGHRTEHSVHSIFTANLPNIFAQHNISLIISAPSSDQVILVWEGAGVGSNVRAHTRVLHTSAHHFPNPMGIAVRGERLTIGGPNAVWELRSVSQQEFAREQAGTDRVRYARHRMYTTDGLEPHEMAFAGRETLGNVPNDSELWVVNTHSNCLCTLDAAGNAQPHWRPPLFNSHASAHASVHQVYLNGLAMVDGRPRYVTARGESDRTSGLLLDVETDKILLQGLALPHSPRWHNEQLYLLESGRGRLIAIQLSQRNPGQLHTRTIAHLPGFARGLALYGSLAFIGVSQVCKPTTAGANGSPLQERQSEQNTCGVWVVHLETGRTMGFLRFEAGLREIHAVQVLPNIRTPKLSEQDDVRSSHSGSA